MNTFEELDLLDEVVVKVGPRQEIQGGKAVIVDAERNVVMTKEGYNLIEKDENGNGVLMPVAVIGTPKWSVENKVRTYEVVPFEGAGKKTKKAKADSEVQE